MFERYRVKGYLMFTPYPWPDKYKTSMLKHWHERLRIKLAKWLFLSVDKPHDEEIKITTGSG